jgi:hypothetical protein
MWADIVKNVLTLGLYAVFEARRKRREELKPEVYAKAEQIRRLKERLEKARCENGDCNCNTDK